MCGLLFTNLTYSKEAFQGALASMSYRGPDVPCNYAEHGIFKLGHNRLSILDKDSHANQPFYSDDKRFVIVYNGEVYNYLELAKEYDIDLHTHCDTELVLKLYLKLGERCLNLLNGMFAFVILDLKTNEFFAARDRLGVKPLYVYQKGDAYIFSSEVAPILALTKDNKLDEIGIRQYKKLRTFFNGRTIYSNIKMFEAGCYFKNQKKQRFWELPLEHKAAPSKEEVHELLTSAVNYRMIADVPLGSYLSGGLDSTIIAKLIADKKRDHFHTWTVGFEDNNEFKWGRIAAEHINSDQHEVLINNDEFISLLKEMVAIRKEPISVPNEVLIYKMTKEAKQYSTVLLSGEGADELFFGYDRIFSWANENKWDIKSFSEKYAYGSDADYEIVEDALSPFVNKYDSCIDIVAAFFQTSHLHGLLRRLDSASMLAEVEARVPFVDYRFIERMAGVPYNARTSSDCPKKLLKDAFRAELPESIIDRQKVGFPVNVNTVLPENATGEQGYDRWLSLNLELLQNVI